MLFLGPDRDRKRERLNTLAQERAVALLDRHEGRATQLSPATLGTLIREHPAVSPLRLVVIEEAQRLSEACVKVLAQHAPLLIHTACVVLLVDGELDARHPLTALTSHATIERFEWLSATAVSQWVRRYLATHQKEMAEAAIRELIHAYGADVAGIRSILDQLVAWTASRPHVTQEDLGIFLPSHQVPIGSASPDETGRQARAPTNHFALVNAVARRDVAAALQALQEQLGAGKDVLELVGLVSWQLQRWLTVSHLLEAGTPLERIESLAGLTPWQLERIRAELAGRSVAFLQHALARCWELDVAAKNGRLPNPRVALEGLVVELCLPRSFAQDGPEASLPSGFSFSGALPSHVTSEAKGRGLPAPSPRLAGQTGMFSASAQGG